VRVAYKYDLM